MIDGGHCRCGKTQILIEPIEGHIAGCHHCGEYLGFTGIGAWYSSTIAGTDDNCNASYGLRVFVFRGVPSTE